MAELDLQACFTFARVLPLCALLVWLSRGLFGWLVSLSLGLSLVPALTLRAQVPQVAIDLPTWPSWPALLVRELALGSLVALALLLPLAAGGWAARFAELGSGPSSTRSGPIATLYALAAAYLCLSLGLQRTLVIGLHESLLTAPVAQAGSPGLGFALGVARLVGSAFALSVALGLPLLMCALLLDTGSALLQRLLGPGARAALWPGLSRPLLVLVAAGLALPILSELPAALRVGLRVLRELTRRALGP